MPYGMGHGINSTSFRVVIKTPQTMRANPSLSFSAANLFQWSYGGYTLTSIGGAEGGTDTFSIDCSASAGITGERAYLLTSSNNQTSYILASAEL